MERTLTLWTLTLTGLDPGRQPMQHTMGVVTDLGFEDIGSRLEYSKI